MIVFIGCMLFGLILSIALFGFILPRDDIKARLKRQKEFPMSIEEAYNRYGPPTGVLYTGPSRRKRKRQNDLP